MLGIHNHQCNDTMKKLTTLILIFCIATALTSMIEKPYVVIYYFSASGSDGNSGTSPSSPWQTISKFNAFPFQIGDSVVFNRGDVWTGTAMTITRSGIHLGAYGTGADPVISGFYTIPAWTNRGSGLYTAKIPAALSSAGIVTLDDAFQPMGRMPKASSGYYNISTNGTTTSLSSGGTTTNNPNTFTGAPQCIGGEVVWRAFHFELWRATITAQTPTSVSFTAFPSVGGGATDPPLAGYGFFLQNHYNTCTTLGEWAYNGTNDTLYMFFGGGGPGSHTVKVSTVQTICAINGASSVHISDLRFEGGNTYLINLNGSATCTLHNVDLFGAGLYGVFANGNSPGLVITNSTINRCNSIGVRYSSGSTGGIMDYDTLTNTAAVAGMGGSGTGEYHAIRDIKNNGQVTNCVVTNTGYNGIVFQGTNNLIKHNLVDSACTVMDDGGGIYCGGQNFSGSKIDSNMVLHTLGKKEGTPDPDNRGEGIYIDDGGNNVEVSYNTSAFNGGQGINVHNGFALNIHNNTCYDNGTSAIRYYNDGNTTATIQLVNNIFFAKTTAELLSRASGGSNHPSTYFSTADNNRWCRPLNEANTFNTLVPSSQSFNFAGWKAFINNEAHSFVTPWSIASTSELRFEYNATTSSLPVSLGATNYLDVFGTNWSTSVTLAPFTSIILKTNGSANQLPTVSAGPDQTITLPTNSVTLAGSATDADGTISSHTWSKVSGGAATITTPSSYTSTITGLTQGVYLFQLSATDNGGGVNTDLMQVTVNAAANVSPTANAGSDRAITLPTNTISQTGSGSDADGTISAYLWTQVSGPSVALITSSSSATSSFNNLVAGTYVFNLRVTDNNGATANDQFSVVVSNAANIPPVANAGIDQTITQPTTTATFAGSATDADGTISSHTWSFISGPATPTITTPSSYTSGITGLSAVGAYTFQLSATDNGSATSTDIMVIQVNAAANVPPVANAGSDKAITLPTTTTTLVGGGTDADGTISAYLWTQVSGPTTATIVSAAQSTTVINNLTTAGTYVFRLRVTDNNGATNTDNVNVVVSNAANIPPVANAGIDQTITQPTSTATFAGSATDADGTISSHTWSFISGPATPTITTPSSYTSGLTGLSAVGAYTFQLSATDNGSATSTDIMVIQVNAAANVPPVANAGADFTDTLPSMFTLTGSGTDADGTIVAYLWTQLSGPTTSILASPSQRITGVTGIQAGTYQYRLRVTDNNGAINTDDITVTVYDSIDAPPLIALVAHAGPDVHPTICAFCSTTSITITGSATDGGLPVATYSWVKLSGPSGGTIVSPTSASTQLTGLLRGTYTYQLTVTDGRNFISTDTVVIDVVKNHLFGKISFLNF
jgi:hypothetical protein